MISYITEAPLANVRKTSGAKTCHLNTCHLKFNGKAQAVIYVVLNTESWVAHNFGIDQKMSFYVFTLCISVLCQNNLTRASGMLGNWLTDE